MGYFDRSKDFGSLNSGSLDLSDPLRNLSPAGQSAESAQSVQTIRGNLGLTQDWQKQTLQYLAASAA